MTFILYSVMAVGLLIFLSQSSYAYVIAKVDLSTSERQVHCIHHAVHSVCGALMMLLSAALLKEVYQAMTNTVFIIACLLLISDALAFVILNRTQHFSMRRDAIKHKWKGEKVFGPEHDREVSVYRTLREITQKNLLRDGLHLILFAILFYYGIL